MDASEKSCRQENRTRGSDSKTDERAETTSSDCSRVACLWRGFSADYSHRADGILQRSRSLSLLPSNTRSTETKPESNRCSNMGPPLVQLANALLVYFHHSLYTFKHFPIPKASKWNAIVFKSQQHNQSWLISSAKGRWPRHCRGEQNHNDMTPPPRSSCPPRNAGLCFLSRVLCLP